LADFQDSFTDTLTGNFATWQLLDISPHLKCVTKLLCEILMLEN